MDKRKLDISIISDVHLGAYECHSKELLNYLRSINPEVLILNGDFIDSAKLKKSQLPEEHKSVVYEILKMSNSGTKVYYISQEYEKIINNSSVFSPKFIHFRKKLELILNEQSYLIFHGADVDSFTKGTRLALKPGTKAYDVLLKIKKFSRNWDTNIKRTSWNGLIKKQIKKSEEAILNFENSVIKIGSKKGYNYVICGHIHQPVIRQISINDRKMVYMNAGDWVENLTALEYRFKKWKLYEYDDLDFKVKNPKLTVKSKKSKIIDKARYSA